MPTSNLEKKQIDLIKESINVYQKCIECRSLFDGRNICFADIEEFVDDRDKSHLFRLKEMSHELFRNSNDASFKEKLYDITIGYIFHEAMKLRENMYQLEYYRPQRDIAHHTLTDQEKKIVHEIGLLVNKAEVRLKEGFKEIKILLNELVGQLKDLILLYKDNYLLPRFIFENEKPLRTIYGKKVFDNLLNGLYSDGRRLLILKAAQSYLESEYYDTARLLFKKVLHLDTRDPLVLFLHMYSSAHYFYFKNMYTRSLMLAEKARDLEAADTIRNIYSNSLNRLISDVSKEIKKRKNT